MRYAILSDAHGRSEKLEAVLADARERGAQRVVSLGDMGGDECVALLRQAGALAVFGNYEVSGWRRLSPEFQAWVLGWPPILVRDDFMAVHAAPWWPRGVAKAWPEASPSVRDFGAWLRRTGGPWRALFPYLSEDEDSLWQALAELETAGKRLLFYGHTHVQAIWHGEPSGRLQQVRNTQITTKAEQHYLVGVGSVGLPEDGGGAAYTLYDAGTGHVQHLRVGIGPARPDA